MSEAEHGAPCEGCLAWEIEGQYACMACMDAEFEAEMRAEGEFFDNYGGEQR